MFAHSYAVEIESILRRINNCMNKYADDLELAQDLVTEIERIAPTNNWSCLNVYRGMSIDKIIEQQGEDSMKDFIEIMKKKIRK